jgi:hypothetical protein
MIRSKWLDWQPADEIMEKSTGAKPTKPTEMGFVGFEGTAQRAFPITRDFTARSDRVRAALRALVDPPGLSDWVKSERPDLTIGGSDLIRQIDAAWCGPLNEFERALERLTAHHAECCREFGARQGKPISRFLEGRQETGRGEEG